MWCPTKKLGPIGSAVLTFVGYKQTDKPNLYIDSLELHCQLLCWILSTHNLNSLISISIVGTYNLILISWFQLFLQGTSGSWKYRIFILLLYVRLFSSYHDKIETTFNSQVFTLIKSFVWRNIFLFWLEINQLSVITLGAVGSIKNLGPIDSWVWFFGYKPKPTDKPTAFMEKFLN